MSKYKIFRVDHYDPALIGRRRRRLNILFAVIAIISAPVFILIHQLFSIGIGETNMILMIALLGFFLFIRFKLRSENEKIKTIGYIEFTRTCIIKRIGDSYTETSYGSLDSVELHKHIPALTISEANTGFYTYILSLNFKDLHKETLIVSDRPLGKRHDLSITETIKTLKKINSI
jgi:hypothetical protein